MADSSLDSGLDTAYFTLILVYNLGMGRPTKYSESVVEITKQYYIWCVKNDECPFAEELAIKLGVDDSTLWHWTNRYDEFREAYEILMTLQRLVLKRKGLSGEYVSNIAHLLLSNSIRASNKCEKGSKKTQIDEKLNNLSVEERKAYSDSITRVFERIYSQPSNVLLG